MSDFDADLVIAAVDEFYSTVDDQRRQELNGVLCRFKSCYDCMRTIETCMRMIGTDSANGGTANLRYFGAVCLYDVIRLRSEEWVVNPAIQITVRQFLINNLTAGTYAQTQSVLKKLSSTLALLALYCIPDIWSEPVADMTHNWASTPELLLEVLSDLAAEFQHIVMPLNQRSKLKTELHRLSNDIIKIIWTVLACGEQASASTKQAAVDCVEQWLQLPLISLGDWTQVLSVVLEAVAKDCAALTNIFDILSEHEDFALMEQLMLNICDYIVVHVKEKVAEELKDDKCSEEVMALVSATCCVIEKAVPTLVAAATKQGNAQLLTQINQLMEALSCLPGKYPIDERVSDLPTMYFKTLGDEIESVKSGEIGQQLMSSIASTYAQVLHSAIFKLTYPEDVLDWSREDVDLFESYRKMRSEVGLDSLNLSRNETLAFLNTQLDEAVRCEDVNRSEACLFIWESLADYLSCVDYPHILNCLQLIASRLAASESATMGLNESRRGKTLANVLFTLSHLVQTHKNASELERAIIPVLLSYMPRIMDASAVLQTLKKYLESRPDSCEELGEPISECCYAYFSDPKRPKKLRLLALECIGYVLSRKRPEDAMNIICRMIGQHIGDLDEVDGNDVARVEGYSFQINIFSSLFGSLTNKRKGNREDDSEPAIVLILQQATPVFERIVAQFQGSRLVDDVCDAVRSALTSLPDKYLPLFFPFVVSLLNSALFTNATSAVALAKSTVLQCGSLVGVDLCNSICHWFKMFEQRVGEQSMDEWLSLMYHIVKKDWKTIRKYRDPSLEAIQSLINVCSLTIVQSSDPCVVRTASQTLACVASQTNNNDDVAVRELLAKNGGDLVKAIFTRIRSELMRQTVEALAEVLYFYFQRFRAETREIINNEPYGNTPFVTAMFRDIGNLRNFKQMTIRLNYAATRDVNS